MTLKGLPRFTVNPQPVLKYRGVDYKRPFPRKVDHLFVQASNSFLTGYGSKKGEPFFNPELGLGFEKTLDKKWSANVSLTYFQVSGIIHAAEFAQTELSFGAETTLTRIKTNKLHFGYIPVVLNFDADPRNSISLGLGMSYLINGQSLVTVSELTENDENEIDRFEDYGYTNGYKPLNTSLLLGYEFRLTAHLTFSASYQYGLSKITRQSVYGQTDEDRNSRLRVGFKYRIRP
jgi:hypothetical protein